MLINTPELFDSVNNGKKLRSSTVESTGDSEIKNEVEAVQFVGGADQDAFKSTVIVAF